MPLFCIVLYANQWRFNDQNTGEVREGTTCQYMLTDNLNFHVDERGAHGYDITKVTLPYDEFNNLPSVPGLYKAMFNPRTSQGRTFFIPSGFKFINGLTVIESEKK